MAERRASTFRQRDITAAIKAAERAGKEVVRVEVGKDGKIVIITARDQEREVNEWDAAFS